MKLAPIARLVCFFTLVFSPFLVWGTRSDNSTPAGQGLALLLFGNQLLDSGEGGASGTGNAKASATTTTLDVPPTAVVGQGVTLTAKVVAEHGPTPAGYVTFYQDNQNIGQATLDINGVASLPTGNLTLRPYYFTARFTSTGDEAASESAGRVVKVYQAPPDMVLSLAPRTLQVFYGSASTPATLHIISRFGLEGDVEFSCSGLPAGMVCEFKPELLPLTADGSATASFIISSPTAQEELTLGLAVVAGFTLVTLLGVETLGEGRRNLRRLLWLTPVLVIALAGCNAGKSQRRAEHEPGPRTVLVNATAGGSTRSITLLLEVH
jgi:hypothetical protein